MIFVVTIVCKQSNCEKMKTNQLIILLISFIALSGCKGDKSPSYDNEFNMDVEIYIQLLKNNQYSYLKLPAFTEKDIPTLLKYRNDTRMISNFPRNPISSLWGPDCRLGVYVLWTIESIRAISIESRYVTMGFPSQNPILALRDSDELKLIDDDESHKVAAQAYYDWWKNNSSKKFDEFKYVDPLGNTKYRWH